MNIHQQWYTVRSFVHGATVIEKEKEKHGPANVLTLYTPSYGGIEIDYLRGTLRLPDWTPLRCRLIATLSQIANYSMHSMYRATGQTVRIVI